LNPDNLQNTLFTASNKVLSRMKIQTKKFVTDSPDLEPILYKAMDQSQTTTAYRDQSHNQSHRRTSLSNTVGLCLANIADHYPTSSATAKHRRPLPIPATIQNRQMSSSTAHAFHKHFIKKITCSFIVFTRQEKKRRNHPILHVIALSYERQNMAITKGRELL
jgi:hypothetical protein